MDDGATLCGAPPTPQDMPPGELWKSRGVRQYRDHDGCEECLSLALDDRR